MLGKRSAQRGIFEADHLYLDFVGRGSFYGFLASQRDQLFSDEEFAALYTLDNGRLSVPPSLLAIALLLQTHDRVSDDEATARAAFDLRRKVALGIGLDERPFAKSTLQLFRAQLLVHDKVRAVFQKSLTFARRTGFLKGPKVKAVLDTSFILGRGAVKDTYNLLADGIVKLVRALSQHAGMALDDYAAAHGLTRYLGLMLGLLARRVLGQYDPALLGREPVETSSLILVEPNVQAWAQKDKLPVDELRRWLAMHEMTHAWEFRAHPWLQSHLEGLLKQVLVGGLADGRRPSRLELIRTLTIGVGQQWKAIAKLQAVMSLLEGYSNLVMNDIGRRELPHFALLEGAYRRRQEQRTPLERAFLRLTGLEMKMRQYVIGEKFCRDVRNAGGQELLNRVWEGPDWLPTMAEIQRPQLFIDRVRSR